MGISVCALHECCSREGCRYILIGYLNGSIKHIGQDGYNGACGTTTQENSFASFGDDGYEVFDIRSDTESVGL
jgi:hypothetical protein